MNNSSYEPIDILHNKRRHKSQPQPQPQPQSQLLAQSRPTNIKTDSKHVNPITRTIIILVCFFLFPYAMMLLLFVVYKIHAAIFNPVPEYDPAVTRQHWEESIKNYDKYFDFKIGDIDENSERINLTLGENAFQYSCRHENIYDHDAEAVCHFVVKDDRGRTYYVEPTIADLLWMLHRDEIGNKANNIDGIYADVQYTKGVSNFFTVKKEEKLKDFYEAIIEIEDYQNYVKYLKDHPDDLNPCFDMANCGDAKKRSPGKILIGQGKEDTYFIDWVIENEIKPFNIEK
jgi:hypothetical protein